MGAAGESSGGRSTGALPMQVKATRAALSAERIAGVEYPAMRCDAHTRNRKRG